MYTRAYFPEDEKINIPEKYNGNAFAEDQSAPVGAEADSAEPAMAHTEPGEGGILGLLSHLGGGLFPAIGRIGHDLHIGWEEILIIGIALFLFLSKGGDRECAIMLLLLLVFQ